jgi:hypothetical protein
MRTSSLNPAEVTASRIGKPFEMTSTFASGPRRQVKGSSAGKPSVLDIATSNEMLDALVTQQMKLVVPAKPLVLLPSHFSTEREPEDVMTSLQGLFDDGFANEVDYGLVNEMDSDYLQLDEDSSIDYEFMQYECGFNGVYVRGSKYCDFKIRIYQDSGKNSAGSTIVEMQRLNRNSCNFTFKQLFAAVKMKLSKSISPCSVTSSSFDLEEILSTSSADFSVSDAFPLNQEEIYSSIKQVLSMMQEPYEESKLEASRILCDLSGEPEIREQMISSGCVATLVTAASSASPLIQQHSVIALAQLSECFECTNAFTASQALPLLMSFVANGPYTNAAMRREAARAVANVAMRSASCVRTALRSESGSKEFKEWRERIPSIIEPTVRERSERALAYLNVN